MRTNVNGGREGARAQCDRGLYLRVMGILGEEGERLELYRGMVLWLVLRGERVGGAVCADGSAFHARCVVLTAGTFLRGSIKMGGARAIPAGGVDGLTVDFGALRGQKSEDGYGRARGASSGGCRALGGRDVGWGDLFARAAVRPVHRGQGPQVPGRGDASGSPSG